MTITESETDVLIIGAGPSGLMCATWLARCGVPFRIIDKRPNEVFTGQADALHIRTLEIFKSFSENWFDFATLEQGWKATHHLAELCFWSPDENGQLKRSMRMPDGIVGASRYGVTAIDQGSVEKWLTESIRQFSGGAVNVERPMLPVSMKINEDADAQAHAVEVLVKRLDDETAKTEQYGQAPNGLFRAFEGDQERYYNGVDTKNCELIRAKYVVGSDGAHSWVRKQLGIPMEGEQTDYIWGVIDMVPITNFPDIRNRCAIHSKDAGSIMVVPRERDLIRLYIQLEEVERADGRIDRSKITPELIVQRAQEIFKPYTFEMTDLNWFTGYQIGQRISPSFSKLNRVFISGDACHSHSPKAGLGMNVSMQDTYNLGFKLALVCKGLARPEVLETYESERMKVAQDLIAYDHKLSRMYSGKPMIPGRDGVDLSEFYKVCEEGAKFMAGVYIDYEESLLVSKKEGPASKVIVGRRLFSDKVMVHADARPVHIADRCVSDGRFRVLVFPGHVKQPENMKTLIEFQEMLGSKEFFLKKYTPVNAFEDSVIDVITIHASERRDIEVAEFPDFTHPLDYKRRCDYWKLYAGVGDTYHQGAIDIYETYGIDKIKGAIIVLRPDSHVAMVTEYSVGGLKEVDGYFGGFMIDQSQNVLPVKTGDDTNRFVEPRLGV
ncbi:Phenol 2-monooxygenase [Candida viswanathii]|uniref:Phenol 2-monooxygenase n=1 Tax=Candida viswanathii TaxID=5486 RepID=A0A367YFA6_9ASCO|nr:Phenol 2-monooxygenase [Candida viswanathii]